MLKDKMQAVIADVNGEVAERTELIECIAIALLTRKNLFILGDTGQAKSYAINEFRKRITGAKQFERLLSKQTDEEAIFGRIDLPGLMQGQIRMITTGKIPDSHIVFLDEIFKANDGILNSLLTALNERRYTNEGEVIDIPTVSFMSASNEIPNFNDPAEKILRPLYDRFDLKVVTQYVGDRQARLDALRKKQFAGVPNVCESISLDELVQMQEEVRLVLVTDAINELMDDILCELRRAGIHVSDRKYFNFTPIAQAKAWLDGCAEISPLHLTALKNYLWTTPEEIPVIEQILTRMCQNPLQDKLNNLHSMAVVCLNQLDSDRDNKKAMIKFRSEYIRLYDMAQDLLSKAESNSEVLQIHDFSGVLEKMSREAHDIMGFTYASLSELKALQ
jgi:MoxR-like ATPase